jgi:hypothetical protein
MIEIKFKPRTFTISDTILNQPLSQMFNPIKNDQLNHLVNILTFKA